jgi:rod shape-determining protein MreD
MSLRRRDYVYYAMIPLLMAAAILQSTALGRIQVFNVKPDLALIMVICGTLVFGIRHSIVWAFAGGVAIDLFSGGPFGVSSLALMAAALVASPGHRTLSRFNLFVPLAAAALGTLAYGLTYMGLLALLNVTVTLPFFTDYGLLATRSALPFLPTLQYVLLPGIAYNTLLMLLFTPLLNMVPESHDAAM